MNKECITTTGKPVGVILVKKGMAMKAFMNNVKTGNTDRLRKQIKKGTVKKIK